jgi:hypothetical protein
MFVLRRKVFGRAAKLHIDRLVYFEEFEAPAAARRRLLQIRAMSRKRRLALITSVNPNWMDKMPDPVTFGGFDISPGWWDDEPGSEGGVAALLPVGPPPRSSGYAQAWPAEYSLLGSESLVDGFQDLRRVRLGP